MAGNPIGGNSAAPFPRRRNREPRAVQRTLSAEAEGSRNPDSPFPRRRNRRTCAGPRTSPYARVPARYGLHPVARRLSAVALRESRPPPAEGEQVSVRIVTWARPRLETPPPPQTTTRQNQTESSSFTASILSE